MTIKTVLQTLNELITAGIAITAFSLLLYALSFNLRDRVARSFALILVCVVIVFVCDAIGGTASSPEEMETWLRLQWVGITFLPAAYLHLSDALLATTGRPSRGRRRLAVRLAYLASLLFLVTLPFYWLVGPVVPNATPAPYLERTWLTWVFTVYYLAIMGLAGVNIFRAYRRTHARSSRRRMTYLLIGSLAPALGSYPYLLFGSGFVVNHSTIFWMTAVVGNMTVLVLLVIMAYAVAFFGVAWPDRVVKRRLLKWVLRGPVTASIVLAITTLVRRAGVGLGVPYSAAVPIIMIATLLILEHMITLGAPLWERWLFRWGGSKDVELLQKVEERLLTSGDLNQFLESLLAAACDRLQVSAGFIAALNPQGINMLVTIGPHDLFEKEELSENLLAAATDNNINKPLFLWGGYWLVPLYTQVSDAKELIGLIGIFRLREADIDPEQKEALFILAKRAALALEDWQAQNRLFVSLEALAPAMEHIQRLRAAASFDSGASLTDDNGMLFQTQGRLARWVKEALTHYWGGPKLTQSPLMGLQIVQRALQEHEDNPTNALRAILREAIEHIRPEGDRRFTGEWILYNILELKFMEGRSVREVALRLAMSEADLFRKQRVAIEVVSKAIMEMEHNVGQEEVL